MIYVRVKELPPYRFEYLPKARVIRSLSGLAVRIRAFGAYWEFGWRALPISRKTFSWARLIDGKDYTEDFYHSKEWGQPQLPSGPPLCQECGKTVGQCLHTPQVLAGARPQKKATFK